MVDARAEMYRGVEFPPYAYKEYPKWMDHPNGTRVLVDSQKDELKILAESPEKTVEQNQADRERNELAQQLNEAQKQIADLQARLNKPSPAPQTSPDPPAQVTKIQAPGTASAVSGSDPAGGAAMAPVTASSDSPAAADRVPSGASAPVASLTPDRSSVSGGPSLPPPATKA